MNIMIFNEETINPEKGGVKRVSYVLNKAFKKDHEVFCVMPLKIEEMDEDNYYYFPDNCIYSTRNVQFIRDFIKEKDIDIILNQNGISPEASEFILKYAPQNVKIITVPHNSLVSTYGLRQHIDFRLIPLIPKSIMNFLDHCTNYYFLQKYKRYWTLVLKRSDSVVLLHKQLLPSTLSFLRLKSCKKITWIENPCTIQKTTNNFSKDNTILFVGRLASVKNVATIIKAWERIYKDCPNWNVVIVGDGQCRTELEKYVLNKKIPRVCFEGTQNPIEYYEKSKIFCMASYYEGMPLVLLEAMELGVVPIVINSFETAPAIVHNGENGILLETFSIKAFAEGLLTLIKDDSLLQMMSKNCIEQSKNYSIDIIKREWYELFEKLLNNNIIYKK